MQFSGKRGSKCRICRKTAEKIPLFSKKNGIFPVIPLIYGFFMWPTEIISVDTMFLTAEAAEYDDSDQDDKPNVVVESIS